MTIRDFERFKQDYHNYGFEKIDDKYVKHLQENKQDWRIEIDNNGEMYLIFRHKNQKDTPKFPSLSALSKAVALVIEKFGFINRKLRFVKKVRVLPEKQDKDNKVGKKKRE